MGDSFIDEPNRLVVNSFLNPNHPMDIYFYTTLKMDSGYWFKAANGVRVLLKEDETILYDAICPDTLLHLDYYPVTGKNYTIEAVLTGYETITAATSIPKTISCEAKVEKVKQFYWNDYRVDLSAFQFPPANEESLWITAYKVFKEDEISQCHTIYVNNILIDKVNQEVGLDETLGSITHNSFMRIKNKNLPKLDKIQFFPGINYEQMQVQIKLIAASKEYDQYNRSLYQQQNMIIYDDDISSVFFQPVQVYSNIRNGLGIFAGWNEVNYFLDIPE
ncbi:hypothetical protein FACS189426_13250 [Bacteroidia bacterium]|nr:hypothetical protein FACS189426_13250 [Bacteroidia bacterium]